MNADEFSHLLKIGSFEELVYFSGLTRMFGTEVKVGSNRRSKMEFARTEGDGKRYIRYLHSLNAAAIRL